ncbi:YciI family protein [Amycolatopsis sp. 195334CR]|uniref:YciI family protein n=1 Tax=Amycolatopsis sp. 195334CR TaxID=2814588 RepID=UPI001A8FD8F2|nr:YciI family protein [Amycolatopsis sp. 195334CR]MBN6040108.1 hypothetical protein [Amycolatopsis sp. 195334CR]
MKQYLLNIQQPVGDPPPPAELEPIMRELNKVNDEMRAAGAWVFAGGLHDPSASSVVRAEDGRVIVTDGPYVEGKEFVGGFTVIRAADLDEALTWAGKVTRALGLPIEVRPFYEVA